MRKFFDRQYRFTAGPKGLALIEIGTARPHVPHINFNIQKTDTETENTSRIQLWNLNKSQLAVLNEKDCVITLKAGYGSLVPLVFSGAVTFVKTESDGADIMTTVEAVDGRIELRDTWLAVSYSGVISTKKIITDIAVRMGLAVVYSYNAMFYDMPNGFSFVGKAGTALDKVCTTCGLTWSIQNGILHIKMYRDALSREAFVLSPETGLVDIPKKITLSAESNSDSSQQGWEAEYLMNAAINIDDYVRVESKYVQGYFRVCSLNISGDNLEGSWTCTAKLLEV